MHDPSYNTYIACFSKPVALSALWATFACDEKLVPYWGKVEGLGIKGLEFRDEGFRV